jgi:hypothetical protein
VVEARDAAFVAHDGASIANRTPSVAGSPIQRATRTRLKWPWPTSTTSPRSRASAVRVMTPSARVATSSAVSPPGHGCVQTVQPGTVFRISAVVRPSYSP